MASAPSSSSDSDTESSTSNYGHVAEEPVHLTYGDGTLAWNSGSLEDADVIVAMGVEGSSTKHTILSLAPIQSASQQSFELRATNATLLPQAFLEKYEIGALPLYLQPSNEIYILISTLSGTGLAPAFFDEVLHPVLQGIGLVDTGYQVIRTSSAESVVEFARSTLLVKANEGKKQTLLMLSGDGGMVDTINGLMGGERSSIYIKPTLAQLPLGTGNALFHSLHKPSPLPSIYVQGLRTLLHGTPKSLPVLQAKFSPGARLLTNESRTATPLPHNVLYGAVVASYGLHATLVADSDTTEYRKHGDKRFGLAANDLLFPSDGNLPHAYKASVTLDGKKIELDEHGYVLITLVSNLEKTFTISPASEPLDGKLRAVHFSPRDGTQTMEVMKAAYNDGKHVQMEDVGYKTVDKVEVQFQEPGQSWKWRRCCVDGLIVGVEEGGWMEIEPVHSSKSAIDILVDTV